MIQLNTLEEATGQGLLYVMRSHDCRSVLLVFTDGVKCELRACNGYGDSDPEIEIETTLALRNYSTDELLKAGVITQQWIDEQNRLKQERLEVQKKNDEMQERIMYQQLRKKFEQQGEAS